MQSASSYSVPSQPVPVATSQATTGHLPTLQAFHEAAMALSAAPSLQGVLQAAVQGAVNLSGASAGRLSINKNVPANGAGTRSEPWLTVEAIAALPSITPPPSLPDISHGTFNGAASDAGDELSVPIVWHGRSLGELHLRNLEGQGFAPEAQTAVQMLCEQAAHAIDGARRFDQLAHAKREWELIFDGMVDGVYICRADGVILRANRSVATMLGLRLIEILGRRREELHARLPDYQVLRPWCHDESSAPDLDLQTAEFRFGSPERVFVDTMFTLLSESASGQARRVCIMRDITEQRRLQDQLLQSEKLAALGELVSGVAHELNNPLTTVVGYGQLLETDPTLPSNARRQIHMIHHEAQRASHIVQNLLAFARRSVPQKTSVSINDIMHSLVRMRSYQLAAEDIKIVTQFEESLPPVWADPMQLQQVFLNIINNAAHAVARARDSENATNATGSVSRSGEITVATQAMPEGVPPSQATGLRVTISDNGPGIAAEHLRRVFDPFFTTKGVGQGTGLGMSISLGIVSNHQGRIWAESRLGQGARFMVELPAAGEREEQEVLPPIPEVPLREGAQSRILVIDDEEPVVTLITEILAMDGHRITPAYNGAEALDLLEHQDFDLIISDVRMPAVGGPTFFETLQTTRPDLLPRVIFVTGDTVSKSTQDFLQKAARPVLAKPFDPERLRALVLENLRSTSGS